ncbi:MAG: DNA internalization-related competence protein ComEC/Rec2 [Hyphomonadaceae bacterium]|nr:DNA internalization-related competence protein ComEC/Rec2 [Clostridia bacterium]
MNGLALGLCVVMGCLSVVLFFRKLRTYAFVSVGLTIMLLGAFYTQWSAQQNRQYYDFLDRTVTFEGRVMTPPVIGKKSTGFIFAVSRVEGQQKQFEMQIAIKHYENLKTPLQFGDQLTIHSVIMPPIAALNKENFDYGTFLKTKGVYLTAIINVSDYAKIGQIINPYSPYDLAFMARNYIARLAERYLQGDAADLCKGFLIGDTSTFSESLTSFLKRCGLTHLVAVSGSHVSFFIVCFAIFFSRFTHRTGVKNTLGIFWIVFFMLIAGCSTSVVRAVAMGVIFLIADMTNREHDPLTSLFVAAFCMLAYRPAILYDVGFQLSSVATLFLIVFFPLLQHKLTFLPPFIRSLLGMTIIAQVATLPLTLYHFQHYAVVGLLANIIIVPVAPLIMLLGIIFALLGNWMPMLAGIVGFLLQRLNDFVIVVAKWLSSIPWAYVAVPAPNVLEILLFCGMMWLCYCWLQGDLTKRNAIIYITILNYLLVWNVATYILPHRDLSLTFINVGQGDASLIQTASHQNILIDGGGTPLDDYDLGENVLLPYLLRHKITTLDIAIVSHYHEDHAEGVLTMLNNLTVKRLILPPLDPDAPLCQRLVQAAKAHEIPITYLAEGRTLPLTKDVTLQSLKTGGASATDDENAQCLVLRLQYGQVSFMFTGDISSEVEHKLLALQPAFHVNALKVAHHGSEFATSQAFLQAFTPEVAAISVGRNSFGHPNKQTLSRLRESGARVYRTDKNGAITVHANQQDITQIALTKGLVR